ncbi:zinc-binding dehydrogenase [Mesorhizobium qingshengii]|uniref:NADPH2:quinone reductase n=1 Tax=Mesorhizobium qingshengii TaxID=1165689 RepID=A0A1G5ZV58_9HYPH|nr:zinc-binding dehydrogenase [Mesorhizobium qingshengii]SDA98681.1 NADPH2:quinone reductase [Mesorhizobium qingshengii]
MKIKAVVATAKGGPEVLQMRDIELRWPRRPDDVLVELRAAALNPADVFFRQLGGYVCGDNPLVLGHDGMGTVKAIGDQVSSVRIGDRVCFCNGGIGDEFGTYAEAAVVPEWQLACVPDSVDDLTAAALPLVGITCWEALYDRAQVRAGEFVLIHGGAGGTGHIAIQLAALRGGRVATTVSTSQKAALVNELGAELAIRYREQDFVEAALGWSRGVNVAFDNAGAQVMQRTFRAMSEYGRVVTLMGTPGDDADSTAYNLNLSIMNVMMLTPMWKGLQSRLMEQVAIVRQVLALVAQGRLKIQHAATFPLAQAGDAHAFLETGQAIGKVTLQIA